MGTVSSVTDESRHMPEHLSRLMEWNGVTVGRFWAWQSQYPHQYFTMRFGRNITNELSSYLYRCKTIVDYGCGPGHLIPHLLKKNFKVAATDQSVEAISATNARYSGHRNFLGARLLEETIADGAKFDALLSVEVIEHLGNDHLTEFFNNVVRLTRPGSVVIVTTPNDEILEDSLVYCPQCDHSFHRYQHVRTWTSESLTATAIAHGLEIVRVYTTDFSKNKLRDPIGLAKRLVKAVLGRAEKRPHLVCVSRVPMAKN